MKLNKKQQIELHNILARLRKAESYIEKEDTLICSKSLPHALSFYDKTGTGITPMNKQAGSDICYLYNGINELEYFIENNC